MAFISEVSKKSPSEMLGIDDELTAFCLDAAVMVKQRKWKNRRDLMRMETMKAFVRQAIYEAHGGEVAPPIDFDDEEDSGKNAETTIAGMTKEDALKNPDVW